MSKSNYQKTIAIDFDGVIHAYREGWKDGTIYDEAVPYAIHSMKKLLARGYKLVIFTCRAETEEGANAVYKWLNKYDIDTALLEVTDRKPKAIAYIDDRGIRFTNWQDVLNYF